MHQLKSVCVYCGSSVGAKPLYMDAAQKLGEILVAEKVNMVFGGGDVGLMGKVANTVVNGGGHVTGIIPEFLRAVEMPSGTVQEMVITETMHERKALMYERSDGFAVLPGGIGTLEEVVEMISWGQLHQHTKPIVLINLDGYWDPFESLLTHVIDHGFARADIRRVWRTVSSVEEVVPVMRDWLKDEDEPPTPMF